MSFFRAYTTLMLAAVIGVLMTVPSNWDSPVLFVLSTVMLVLLFRSLIRQFDGRNDE